MYVIALGFDENDDPTARTLIEPPLGDDNTVSELRLRVAEILKKPSDDFNLMYCGEILSDEKATLASTNIRALSSTVHVIPKPKIQPQSSSLSRWKDPVNNHEMIKKFVVSFTHMVHCNLLETASHRLKKRENLDDLIATCPDLAQDPLALSMLSHPDILSQCLLNPDVALKISGEHPALLEACQNLAVAAHEEKLLYGPERDRLNDAFMEASEGEEEEEGPAEQEGQMMRNRAIITADQLANALLQAQQRVPIQGASSSSASRNPQVEPGPSGSATSPNAESLFSQRSPYSQLPPLGPGPSRPPSIFNQTPIFGQLPYPASAPSRPSGSGVSRITPDQLSAALASTFASQISPSAINQQLSLGIRPSLPPAQTNSLAQALAEALAQSLATPPPPPPASAAATNLEEEQPMDLTNSTDQQPSGPANDSQPNPEDNTE